MIYSAPYLSDHPLYLSYLPGRSDCLVISFSGVGLDPEDIPKVEAASLAGQQGKNHVLFVSDASRSWMNFPGQMAKLKVGISRLADEIKPSRIVAIGNSMGGTSALIYAAEAKVDAVLAIVPQYSVYPGVIRRESRWTEYSKHITDWSYPTVPDLSGQDTAVVILHGTASGEMMHARCFKQGRNVHHYLFKDFDHDLADRLKTNKTIQPIVVNLIADNLPEACKAITAAGGIPFKQYKQHAKAAKRERLSHDPIQ